MLEQGMEWQFIFWYMGVSKNSDTPKSSIFIGSSITNHPFWGTPIFWKHPYFHGRYEREATLKTGPWLFILAEAGNGGNRATCELWWSPQYRLQWGGKGNQMRYTTLHQCFIRVFFFDQWIKVKQDCCMDFVMMKANFSSSGTSTEDQGLFGRGEQNAWRWPCEETKLCCWFGQTSLVSAFWLRGRCFLIGGWLGDVPRWPWLEKHHRIGTGLGRQISCGFEGRHIHLEEFLPNLNPRSVSSPSRA